jgi:transposase IS66 family protein
VVFDFRLGRGRDGPKRFLGQFEGILQTDGYSAYDQIGGPRIPLLEWTLLLLEGTSSITAVPRVRLWGLDGN